MYYYSPWHDVAYARAIIHCCLQIAQLDFFGIVVYTFFFFSVLSFNFRSIRSSQCRNIHVILSFFLNNNSDVHIGNGSLQDQRRESESSNDGVTDSICACTGIRMPTCLFPPPLSLFNIRALRFCAVHVHKCTLRTKSSGNPILNGSSISSLTASDGRQLLHWMEIASKKAKQENKKKKKRSRNMSLHISVTRYSC